MSTLIYINFLNTQQEHAYFKSFNADLQNRFPNEKNLSDYLNVFNTTLLEVDTNNINVSQGALINKVAPNFTAKTYQNDNIQLSQFKDKNVVVYFWAPWNKKSIEESKTLLQLNDTNIVMIGVSIDDQVDSWTQTIEQNKLSGYQISSHNSWECKIARSMHVSQIPYFVIINNKGIIQATTQLASKAQQQVKELVINSLNTIK